MSVINYFKNENITDFKIKKTNNNVNILNLLEKLPPLSIPKIRRCHMLEKLDRLIPDKNWSSYNNQNFEKLNFGIQSHIPVPVPATSQGGLGRRTMLEAL